MLANESAETFVPVGFKLVRTGLGIFGTIGSFTTVSATTTGFDSSVEICALIVGTSVIE